jgi:hypothetical protein
MSQWTSSVSAPIRQALRRLTQMARTFHPGMLGLITGVFVVGLALLILVLRDRIGFWAATHASITHPQLAIVQLYTRMLRTLDRYGMKKPPAVTASEFSKLIERDWKAASPMVADVTALYHQGRFSRTPLTPGELSRAAEQLGRLQSLTHTVR